MDKGTPDYLFCTAGIGCREKGMGLVETILILLIAALIGHSFFPFYHERTFSFEGKTCVIRINRMTGTVTSLRDGKWEKIAFENSAEYHKKIRLPPSFFSPGVGKEAAPRPSGQEQAIKPKGEGTADSIEASKNLLPGWENTGERFYTVQISSIRNVSIAVEYMEQLRGQRLDVHWDRWTSPSGKIWIRVFLGRYRSFGEAKNAFERGNWTDNYPGSFILRLPEKTWEETEGLSIHGPQP